MVVLAHVTRLKPQEIWDTISEFLLQKDESAGRFRSSLHGWYGALLDVDQAINWAELHRPDGPRILAALTCPAGVPLARLARELLIRYPEEVGSSLVANFYTDSVGENATDWLQNKLNAARDWACDSHPHVKEWSSGLVKSLEALIRKAQREEREEDL